MCYCLSTFIIFIKQILCKVIFKIERMLKKFDFVPTMALDADDSTDLTERTILVASMTYWIRLIENMRLQTKTQKWEDKNFNIKKMFC